MQRFNAQIQIIGINPYVLLPDEVLDGIFTQAKKDKGPMPVKGFVNLKIELRRCPINGLFKRRC